MKKFLSVLIVCLVGYFFAFVSLAQAQLEEQINHFDSHITINQDTSLTITEQIEYQTTLDKHGIYRYLPMTYNRDGLKDILRISRVSVTDGHNRQIPFSTSGDGQFLTLKIGDPDQTFTGAQTYTLIYTVEKGLNRFETHDELYWDITGEGWQVPILKSTATIQSPFAQIGKIECFTGAVGGNDKLCQMKVDQEQLATFSYGQQIAYGQNFTVVVGLDKNNSLIFPSRWDDAWSWLRYNWALFLVPLPLIVMFRWWFKQGRDFEFFTPNIFDMNPNRPTRLKAFRLTFHIPYVYEPLKALTPGEAGALLKENVSPTDVVAEILELARKKYLRMEVIEKKRFFGTDRDYQMTKLKGTTKSLTAVQAYLYQELFKKKDVVTVSGLKGTFYLVMQKASEKIEQALMDKKVFVNQFSMTRVIGFGSFITMVAVTFMAIAAQLFPVGIYWPLLALVLQLPFGFLLAYNLPQKTAVGNNLWLQARGLKKSIEYGKWREEIKEKNLFIEEVLPFAVSLGVIQQLSKQMQDLNIEPPSYMAHSGIGLWSTQQFVNGFSNEVSSALSYNPTSSKADGGSGFSGGSSGGGGGGGGGGSW